MMNGQLGMPLAPELAVFALAILVLLAGIIRPGRAIGWIAFIGLLAIFGGGSAAARTPSCSWSSQCCEKA